MSSIQPTLVQRSGKARRKPAHRGKPCGLCGGTGSITGADLGAFGMVEEDGTPIPMTCLACEGSGVEPAVGLPNDA